MRTVSSITLTLSARELREWPKVPGADGKNGPGGETTKHSAATVLLNLFAMGWPSIPDMEKEIAGRLAEPERDDLEKLTWMAKYLLNHGFNGAAHLLRFVAMPSRSHGVQRLRLGRYPPEHRCHKDVLRGA